MLGKKITWEEAVDAFTFAFRDALDLRLVEGSLTMQETLRAQELVEQKYAHPSWTLRL
jgi:lipoate-protein ligase A